VATTQPAPDELADLLDSEVIGIQRVWDALRSRHQKYHRNYRAFEREAGDKFQEIGFIVGITWNEYSVGGVRQEGLMPTIEIRSRCERKGFDRDQMVREVTDNILGLPGQAKGDVIKTDDGEAFKRFREAAGNARPHSHDEGEPFDGAHSHPHPHGH
jgi:hypothetical protein